jgi:hypothetical protein
VIVSLEDNSTDRKTSDNLLRMMQEKLLHAQSYYGVKIVGVASDSSGESKKARKDLAALRPDLIVVPCYAHQVCRHINLILVYI